MKRYMRSTALLSLLLAVGCGDRGDTSAPNVDDTKTPAAAEPGGGAPPAAADRSSADGTPSTEGARATAGARTGSSASPSQPVARPEEPSVPARAPDAAAARGAAEWREVTIPAGTVLPLELETGLSSETATVEAPVRARLKQALIVNGIPALPAGALVSGEVTEAERAGKVKGRSRLAFTFSQVRADNVSTAMKTAPLVYVGEATTGEDATKIGAGAVGGAIVGGILGGGGGAAKGAAIGGAAGTGVVLATRGREVELPSGTDLAASLAAPLTIRVAVR